VQPDNNTDITINTKNLIKILINNSMNKDSHLIFETYANTSANKQILEEGLFDRVKAKGAQAVGTVKGLGQQAAGAVKGAVAGAKGDVAGVQAAQQQQQAGKVAGSLAKIESYQATATKKLQKTANEIFADMGKLGIDVQKISPNSINVFVGQLTKAFDALKKEVTGNQPVAPNTGSSNPPPTTTTSTTP
jgi:hypothetical protein